MIPEKTIDMISEYAQWQIAIQDALTEFYPDLDASDCDSGDPLDFTMTQINMTLIHLQDKIDEAAKIMRSLVRYRTNAGAIKFQLEKADDYIFAAAAWLAEIDEEKGDELFK